MSKGLEPAPSRDAIADTIKKTVEEKFGALEGYHGIVISFDDEFPHEEIAIVRIVLDKTVDGDARREHRGISTELRRALISIHADVFPLVRFIPKELYVGAKPEIRRSA